MTRENNDLTIAYMAGYHKAKGECKDDFKSRTCENCKHSDLLDTDEYACSLEYMIAEFNTYPQYPLIVDSDYGCVKFERKDK